MLILQPIFTSVAAHLYVCDLAKSIDFFTAKLGFTTDFLYGEPPFYAQVSRDHAHLALRSMDGPIFEEDIRQREDLLSASITVAAAAEIQQLYLTYQATGVLFHQPLRDEPWHAKTFVLQDSDGNLILFAGPSS